MAREALVDTSGFYALLVKADAAHKPAREVIDRAVKNKSLFVTTDYILDETATLLSARGYGHLVPEYFESVFSSKACRVEWMNPERFGKTRSFFQKHKDHVWSFTDCFSFVLMKEQGIHEAVTKDSHFKEAGFIPLLI
jgi:predicted nucleic acid-binding protein